MQLRTSRLFATAPVTALAFSAFDDTTVAACAKDGAIKLWRVGASSDDVAVAPCAGDRVLARCLSLFPLCGVSVLDVTLRSYTVACRVHRRCRRCCRDAHECDGGERRRHLLRSVSS